MGWLSALSVPLSVFCLRASVSQSVSGGEKALPPLLAALTGPVCPPGISAEAHPDLQRHAIPSLRTWGEKRRPRMAPSPWLLEGRLQAWAGEG